MPLTPTQTRAQLAQLGLSPRPRLGQNFLTDGNIVRKSLELAAIAPEDTVVEIGPGLGTLSAALLAAGAEVYAVEIDRLLHAHLEQTLVITYPEKFHLLEGDAVEHPRAGLESASSYKVVANVPYAVSTPWLDALLAGPLPERMVLMLQREAAERFTAPPNTPERGAISIFVEAAYERQPGHPVARTCFFPVPQVDSVLLCLVRRSNPRVFHAVTKKFIRELFTHRRKQLGALVKQQTGKPDAPHAALAGRTSEWLDSLSMHGTDSRARPEAVPLSAWLALDEILRS
jgi:16S rRNA (adenine1518-N6/adenine1519-N6)-dimethyltransferase